MTQTRKCPHCAEEVLIDARKCKHCQGVVTQNLPAGTALAILGISLIVIFGFVYYSFYQGVDTSSIVSSQVSNVTSGAVNLSNPVVTRAEYNKIESGMSYSEVTSIIGESGEELSSNDIGGYETIMYQWVNPDGSNMNALFQKDKMVQKAQFELK